RARRAATLGAAREPRAVVVLAHRLAVDRCGEARPAGAGIELRVRGEQRRPAANAAVIPRALLVPRGTGERALGAVLAGHVILLGRELGAPFGLALGHLPLRPRVGHDQPLDLVLCRAIRCFAHTWVGARAGTSRTPSN